MIVKQYIKDFEKLGFGLFVHFGLYSVVGKGEWYQGIRKLPYDEYYQKGMQLFSPARDWAKKLVQTAKRAGCKYITLTTRHHDGFSLFDTCGLNELDSLHAACKRDLVREFVDECRANQIVPFFYHTLLDWYQESYENDFRQYLVYLRNSVELLCKNYGKIGGIWFDGMWNKPNEDWEEDLLYKTIRKHQPEAMIINNTGLNARGALGHIELDSVTFERGKPSPINMEGAPKYIASEMCQTLNGHWGYTEYDLAYCSLKSLIEDFCSCRRYGSNFLLNVGPMGTGYLRNLDRAMIEGVGKWVEIYKEAVYLPRPYLTKTTTERNFVLKNGDTYYLFCQGLPTVGDPNVVINSAENGEYTDELVIPQRVQRIAWLDDPAEALAFEQHGDRVRVVTPPFGYGKQLVVRVARIETQQA